MARGVLMERHGWSVTEAARQLTDMAAAAGMPEHEMAAAVLRQEPLTGPELAEPDHEPRLADDPAAVVAAERARDGAELVGALAEQLRPRFGAVAVAVWLLDADGALEMLGADGLGGTESSRWRRLPPQLDCAEQRVAFTGDDLWGLTGPPPETGPLPAIAPWGRAAARAVLGAAAQVGRQARRGGGLVAGAARRLRRRRAGEADRRRRRVRGRARRAHGDGNGRVDRPVSRGVHGCLTRSPTPC